MNFTIRLILDVVGSILAGLLIFWIGQKVYRWYTEPVLIQAIVIDVHIHETTQWHPFHQNKSYWNK